MYLSLKLYSLDDYKSCIIFQVFIQNQKSIILTSKKTKKFKKIKISVTATNTTKLF